MHLIIMRGIPGSGKSSLAERIRYELLRKNQTGFIYSSDDFWMKNGEYKFIPTLLGKAHAWNLTRFAKSCEAKHDFAIIDNTNTTWGDCRLYVQKMRELTEDRRVTFYEPDTDWKNDAEICAKKNTHGVPQASIQKMLDRFESQESILGMVKQANMHGEYKIGL